MKTLHVRVRAVRRGGHVDVTVFSGMVESDDHTLGNCGTLCFREDEWPSVQAQWSQLGWTITSTLG
jgi:hypothetical protein